MQTTGFVVRCRLGYKHPNPVGQYVLVVGDLLSAVAVERLLSAVYLSA